MIILDLVLMKVYLEDPCQALRSEGPKEGAKVAGLALDLVPMTTAISLKVILRSSSAAR